MTTYFLSHGSPMLLEPGQVARNFLLELPQQIPRPKAIVAVSAHWDTTVPTVSSMKQNDTIYDFYGFPKNLYKMKYDAPGSPELAERVVELLRRAGFGSAKTDPKRGLDHGSWVPLILMYPEKDVPVIQLSIQCTKDGAHHYNIGRAIAPLKDEGVLILGLGNATHNLRELDFHHTGPVVSWAKAFDDWLNDTLADKRHDDLINYLEKAPNAMRAHPTPDHYLPILVALGAAGPNAKSERIHISWECGSISMASFVFKGEGTS